MPTTVVKTIGPSGCDYTTVSAWWAALPDMVATDTIQVGEVQAGAEIVENLSLGAKTTDATRYPVLRGAVPRADGPLRYDPSLGPAIRGSFGSVSTGYLRIEDLQFYHNTFITSFVLKSAGHRMTNVLIEGNGVNRILDTRGTPTAGSYCKNVALIYDTTSTSFPYICIEQTVPAEFDNLLIVRPTNRTSGNTAIFCGNWVKLQNSAVFGFSTIVSGSIDSTSQYNASNATWPAGTNNINGLTATAQFTNSSAASGTHDFRPVDGSGLDAAGVDLSGVGVTTDIVGTTRAAAPTIGPYEIPSATPATATPGPGTLTLAGQAPTVTAGALALPGAGAIALQGRAPTATASGPVDAAPDPIATSGIAWTGQRRRVTWDGEARRVPWTGRPRVVTWQRD